MIRSVLELTPDELLSTTRSVRRRLDLSRPVERELIEECLRLAQQAPSGGNRQGATFVVVTDPERRRALGDIYRRAWDRYRAEGVLGGAPRRDPDPGKRDQQRRIGRSAGYLAEHLGEVPVHVMACHPGRTEEMPQVVQASAWGSVLPAVWSFMLAARARGLGSAWTTIHLFYEREAAEVLGIPYEEVSQVALIPLAHTVGTDFRAGPREPLDRFARWDAW
jgi:nitroreductase